MIFCEIVFLLYVFYIIVYLIVLKNIIKIFGFVIFIYNLNGLVELFLIYFIRFVN